MSFTIIYSNQNNGINGRDSARQWPLHVNQRTTVRRGQSFTGMLQNIRSKEKNTNAHVLLRYFVIQD
jgi:hypothetical protein